MAKYKSYDDAYRNGREDVWPGCGILGRCMSCGRVHNFTYRADARRIADDFRCWRNNEYGCPRPKPEPAHDLNRVGRCKRCGAKEVMTGERGGGQKLGVR